MSPGAINEGDGLADCCERPNLRTIYRGPRGCVEECQRCGFSYGYDGDGEPTEATRAALSLARSNGGGE